MNARLQHVENMEVRQARLHDDPPSTGWYICTANGFIVRGPYLDRAQAEKALEQRLAWVQAEIADDAA